MAKCEQKDSLLPNVFQACYALAVARIYQGILKGYLQGHRGVFTWFLPWFPFLFCVQPPPKVKTELFVKMR